MNIDTYYPEIDKNNFYLGMISQVYRSNAVLQVENLSLLNNRKIKQETLVPNTINFFVVIDSAHGLFLGEIFQSKVSGTDSLHKSKSDDKKEKVFPEISIDIVGLLENDDKFKLSGFKTVGITDKVYIANKQLIKKYLESIEVHTYFKDKDTGVTQEKLNNLAKIGNFESEYLSLQPNTLFDRHLMAIGTTNSGKSTSALAILDKLITSDRKVLVIDPTGEYKKSFPEDNVKKLTLGVNTILPIGEISIRQWAMIFQTNDGTQETELTKAITALRYQNIHSNKGVFIKLGQSVTSIDSQLSTVNSSNFYGDFDLKLLPEQIMANAVKKDDSRARTGLYVEDTFYEGINRWVSEKVANTLANSSFEEFFHSDSDKVNLLSAIEEFIIEENTSLYIDASEIGTIDGIGSMIIDLISNYVINKKKKKIKPFVIFVDEVHRYLGISNEYQSGMIACAREGRKKGIFLFLTTQNPKDVPEVLLGQVGTLIIHRVTHSEELKAIQNHVHYNTISQIQKLNQGEAILTSINLLQDIHVRFEKCGRVHENDTPIL
ncbi:ATP-binding protein [Lactococcus lactis]|uniref:ATP-binding protein n=1 Tax=Lactococcus lactis TaxID=1358 RepID=UPI0021A89D2A|nr:helicase HerA-like domain-containing protein [Lactococcus lactis]MCT3124473.1 ATP-binding protein [Lactococcus lactis]